MKSIAKIASLVALAVTILPTILYFFGVIEAEPMKWVALLGTVCWFVATPLWIGRE